MRRKSLGVIPGDSISSLSGRSKDAAEWNRRTTHRTRVKRFPNDSMTKCLNESISLGFCRRYQHENHEDEHQGSRQFAQNFPSNVTHLRSSDMRRPAE